MALATSEVLFRFIYASASPLKTATSAGTAVMPLPGVLTMSSAGPGSGGVKAQCKHAKGIFGWDLEGNDNDVCVEDLWSMGKGS